MPISETEKTGLTVNPIYWGNTYTIDNQPIQIIGYQGNKGIAQYQDGQKGLVGLPDNWTQYMGPEVTVMGTSPKTKLQQAQAVSSLLNQKAYDNMTGEERYNAKEKAAQTRREMAQIYSPEELNKWSQQSITNGVNSILKDPARNIDQVMLGTIAAPIAAAATAEAWPIVQAVGQWALSNPYINAALTSIGGAHAYNSIKNGSANAMTALELMPMVGLGSKLWNTGIRSIKGIKDGSSSYSPWAIVPKNFKPSPYGELKEVDLTKPEGLQKQKEYAKTFVEEVLIPRAQQLGIWNQEFVDKWNLMHPDIQLKSLGSSTWGFYNKNGIKLNDDNIPISTLLHELRHSFDANSSGITNRNFFLRLLASNRIKGINNKAIELTPQQEDVIRNAYLVKKPSLKHKLKSFLDRSSYYGDIEEMIATNTEAQAALYNQFVKEGGMRAAPETFYEWIDSMDEMELVRRIEAGVKNGYWQDYKYYNTFDLLPENAIEDSHLSSNFRSQYQDNVIDWAKRLKKALKIPGLLPIIPATQAVQNSTNNSQALGGILSKNSDSTILADNNNYIQDFKGNKYGLPTVRYDNGGHLFKDGDTVYSLPTSQFSINPTTGRSRNPYTGEYTDVQVLPELIVKGTSAQTKTANAKAISDLLYKNAYDGMTGEERYEAQRRAQNTALGLQLEKTPEEYSRIANEGMNKALTNMFKDPAKDLDKVMLGTLAAGVAPMALPEIVSGATTALANPYVDAALTSYFGAHGINDIVNGNANAMTALEVLPMARLAKPLWNAGKSASKAAWNYASNVVDNVARRAYAPYDLYRTIEETTPRAFPRTTYFSTEGLLPYNHLMIDGRLNDFANTRAGLETPAYFFRAPKKIDVLKLKNGSFRAGNYGNDNANILPSGHVDGKFVSYGEPWGEFGFSDETSALYEFPVGEGRSAHIKATDWRGNTQDYTAKDAYEYTLQQEELQKELDTIKETIGWDNFKYNYAPIRKDLIERKYPLLKKNIDTRIYFGNQTVIPNSEWNFESFLKEPFWKYTTDEASGQVQRELFMPSYSGPKESSPTISWEDAINPNYPEITAENAVSITPEQWTAAQDAAIARGDMVEAQRLSDLHADINGYNSSIPLFHGTDTKFTEFDINKFGKSDAGNLGRGFYITPHYEAAYPYAKYNDKDVMRLYTNVKHPANAFEVSGADLAMIGEKSVDDAKSVVKKWIEQHKAEDIEGYHPEMLDYYNSLLPEINEDRLAMLNSKYDSKMLGDNLKSTGELATTKSSQMKLADAVTYDKGIRIPLGNRHNSNIDDIRYGLIPLGIGAAGYGLYDNFNNTNSDIHAYDGPLVQHANKFIIED